MPKPGISHDPKDAPHYSHKFFYIYWSYLKQKILAIQDDNRSNYPFLKQWVGMEVDINDQWSLNNGVLGYEVVLHNAKKHPIHYFIRLKTKDAEHILKTEHNVIGVCDRNKKLLYCFVPLNMTQLMIFLTGKKETDKKVKEKTYGLYGMRGWNIE